MKSAGKYSSSRLIRIIEIEEDHIKHRKRLAEIRSSIKFERARESKEQKQIDRANKRRRKAAKNYQLKLDQDRIQYDNDVLHEHLKKVYTRHGSTH